LVGSGNGSREAQPRYSLRYLRLVSLSHAHATCSCHTHTCTPTRQHTSKLTHTRTGASYYVVMLATSPTRCPSTDPPPPRQQAGKHRSYPFDIRPSTLPTFARYPTRSHRSTVSRCPRICHRQHCVTRSV